MASDDEVDPEELKPMGIHRQQAVFEEMLWKLIILFQNDEFDLPDANIIYVFEDVKQRLLEEVDMGTEMLDSEEEIDDDDLV